MNEPLTERLRQLSDLEPGWYANVGKRTGEKCCATMREAADRITALEAALKEIADQATEFEVARAARFALAS